MVRMFLYSALVFSFLLTLLGGFVYFHQPPDFKSALGSMPVVSIDVRDTPNVTSIANRLYFSGQPNAGAILAFQEKGVNTVINLRTPDEMAKVSFDEANLVKTLGMTYINFPVSADTTIADLQPLFDILDEKIEQPLLLHCASANRVDFVWAAYLASRADVKRDKAITLGNSVGLSSESLRDRINNL